MKKQPRSAVLVIRDNRLLVIRRDKSSEPTYFVLPGGGIEDGETPEQAAGREMQEELATKIQVLSVAKDTQSLNRETYIIKANLVGDVEPAWQEEHKQTPGNRYAVEWLPLSRLQDVSIFPEGTVKAALES